jgi:branched-chain amino acid transport system permease protein
MSNKLLRWWPVPALLVLLVYPLALPEPYYHVLGFNILMYATMATSWNIMGGYTGYRSLGHSAFYGLGAYAVAIAANRLEWNPLISAPFLALGVALVAMLLGWIMLRTTGSAFVIATIAMLLIFQLLALNLKDLTNGAPGLSQPIPPWPPMLSRMPFYYYMLGCLAAAIAVSAYVRRSRFGLGLLAIRNDEGKAETVGVNTTLYKTLAFGISAYFVALCGGVWSYAQTHISPPFAFDIVVGVQMILMTMLGGSGTVWGPVLGAFIVVPISDLTLFSFGGSPIYLAILGSLMLAIIFFLPRGILPTINHWLEARRAPVRAHDGALSMAEMHAKQGNYDDVPVKQAKVEKS